MALSAQDRSQLLQLARSAIERAARHQSPPAVDLDHIPSSLRQDGASFVTLTKRGQLRGCIGSLEPRRPLILDVRENAVGAAFHDPRFPAVAVHELDDIVVELSVLSAPQPLTYQGPRDLLEKLRPGIDGVVLESGLHRATFLPQVWEKLPDAQLFLERLCIKAGLPADAYRQLDLDVYTYQVEKFSEES